MKKIAVLTSGGDAPGMNAALRAVTRSALWHGASVVGVEQGYEGLIDGRFVALDARSVGSIIHRGGTMLRTARSERFRTPEGREQALQALKKEGVDGLVVIGGDGSFRGAHALCEAGFPTIGVPATIDNDLYGTDMTIGCDTALNTALDAVRRLRDTASSHDRLFIVEVMGRDSGYIALHTAIAGGAEIAVVPERPLLPSAICDQLKESRRRGKSYSLVVVAEGAMSGHALADALSDCGAFEARVTVLGYIQRGGSPSAYDAALATQLGSHAVDLLFEGKRDLMAGLVAGKLTDTPFPETWQKQKELKVELLDLVSRMGI